MHNSEAPFVAALIGLDREESTTTSTTLNTLPLSDLQGYVDLIFLVACIFLDWILALPRLDLLLFILVGKFLFSMLRIPSVVSEPGSMRRCFVRVEHFSVVGVDLLVATPPTCTDWFCGIVRCSGPDQLYSLRIETGSALDMQLVLHKQLAGVSRSHYS